MSGSIELGCLSLREYFCVATPLELEALLVILHGSIELCTLLEIDDRVEWSRLKYGNEFSMLGCLVGKPGVLSRTKNTFLKAILWGRQVGMFASLRVYP